MPRETLQQRLRELDGQVLTLASMVEKAVLRSVEAIRTGDQGTARRVVEDDAEVNRCRYGIEERAIHLIATQQPMAGDLRELLAALFIATELERIGDHAEGNGRIALMLGGRPAEGPLEALTEMAEKGVSMLRRAIDAFVRRDADAARAVSAEDDQVDAIYSQVVAGLIRRGGLTPDDLTLVTYLMWTAHNLERVADRVTNICERVIFMTTGRLEEVNVSRY